MFAGKVRLARLVSSAVAAARVEVTAAKAPVPDGCVEMALCSSFP